MNDGITLRTFGDLIRHGYQLTGYCGRCSVHKMIDLTNPDPDRPYVGAKFKCRDYEGSVQITLSQIEKRNDAHLPALDRWRNGLNQPLKY
ncbi:MAG: hypothetical protein H6887_00565 [Hoeflea sp.]|nr:hypothetical protein [Hoeflea sp.]